MTVSIATRTPSSRQCPGQRCPECGIPVTSRGGSNVSIPPLSSRLHLVTVCARVSYVYAGSQQTHTCSRTSSLRVTLVEGLKPECTARLKGRGDSSRSLWDGHWEADTVPRRMLASQPETGQQTYSGAGMGVARAKVWTSALGGHDHWGYTWLQGPSLRSLD